MIEAFAVLSATALGATVFWWLARPGKSPSTASQEPSACYRETLREIGMAVPGCDDPFDFDAPVSPDKAELN